MNNEASTSLATKLVAFRKDNRWSQLQLAEALKVSQPTVSRLETTDADVSDMGMLITIARLLMCKVTDLLPKGSPSAEAAATGLNSPTFMAFCPNALCRRNLPCRTIDGSVGINWKSAGTYPLAAFRRVNFCSWCKAKVVKACPNCKSCLAGAGHPYCQQCGAEVFTVPTAREWRKVKKWLEDCEVELARRAERDEEF